MKIIWLSLAEEDMNKIYNFYARESVVTAVNLYNRILSEVDILLNFPMIGPVEPLLESNLLNIRYLLVAKGRFKVIYDSDQHFIYIYRIWDCRQSPELLVSGFIKDSDCNL